LRKQAVNVLLLVIVFSESVGFIVELADAEGSLSIYSGKDQLITQSVISTHNAASLQCKTISNKEWIKLVKRRIGWTSSFQNK